MRPTWENVEIKETSLIAGKSGVGKSTLATALAARGHTVLSDELCVVDVTGTQGPRLHWAPILRAGHAVASSESALPRTLPVAAMYVLAPFCVEPQNDTFKMEDWLHWPVLAHDLDVLAEVARQSQRLMVTLPVKRLQRTLDLSRLGVQVLELERGPEVLAGLVDRR